MHSFHQIITAGIHRRTPLRAVRQTLIATLVAACLGSAQAS